MQLVIGLAKMNSEGNQASNSSDASAVQEALLDVLAIASPLAARTATTVEQQSGVLAALFPEDAASRSASSSALEKAASLQKQQLDDVKILFWMITPFHHRRIKNQRRFCLLNPQWWKTRLFFIVFWPT